MVGYLCAAEKWTCSEGASFTSQVSCYSKVPRIKAVWLIQIRPAWMCQVFEQTLQIEPTTDLFQEPKKQNSFQKSLCPFWDVWVTIPVIGDLQLEITNNFTTRKSGEGSQASKIWSQLCLPTAHLHCARRNGISPRMRGTGVPSPLPPAQEAKAIVEGTVLSCKPGRSLKKTKRVETKKKNPICLDICPKVCLTYVHVYVYVQFTVYLLSCSLPLKSPDSLRGRYANMLAARIVCHGDICIRSSFFQEDLEIDLHV